MAKESGLGWTTLSVQNSAASAKDLKNDITDVSWNITRNPLDTTGLDNSAVSRLLGLADFSITMNGVFNPSSNQAHDVFDDVGSADVNRVIIAVISTKTLSNSCILLDYALTRAATGEFTWTVPGVLSSGGDPTWA